MRHTSAHKPRPSGGFLSLDEHFIFIGAGERAAETETDPTGVVVVGAEKYQGQRGGDGGAGGRCRTADLFGEIITNGRCAVFPRGTLGF